MSAGSDQEVLERWWAGLPETVPAAVRGLWFGMTDLAGSVSEWPRHLYVAGCPSYDPEDGTAEWATDYCWWPEHYVFLPTVAAIPDSHFRDALELAADLVRRLDPLARLDQVEGGAVGFDDGDFVLL